MFRAPCNLHSSCSRTSRPLRARPAARLPHEARIFSCVARRGKKKGTASPWSPFCRCSLLPSACCVTCRVRPVSRSSSPSGRGASFPALPLVLPAPGCLRPRGSCLSGRIDFCVRNHAASPPSCFGKAPEKEPGCGPLANPLPPPYPRFSFAGAFPCPRSPPPG